MLPSAFLQRMQRLLGADYDAFLRELSREDSVHAFRVNSLKTDTAHFCTLLPVPPKAIPFASDGFYSLWDKPGSTPYHHAGMIYMQDPSAMATAHALPIGRDFRILDACAAPGGKAGQLCALAPDGVIVANEYVSARARILQGNLERLGARNAVVTNLDTAVLTQVYPNFFDLIVADAPCSGEGMFRKNSVAISEWSEENVSLCAARQQEILCNLAPCVRPGGYLLYSTCTFSEAENEQTVVRFLQAHPDFSLRPVAKEVCAHTAPGLMQDGTDLDLTLTRRFYPHLSQGEGQYIALMQRAPDAPTARGSKKKKGRIAPAVTLASQKETEVVRAFLASVLSEVPSLPVYKSKDAFYLCPEVPLPDFGVVAAGVCVGTLQNGRIVPHHQLFSAYGTLFLRKAELSCDDPRLCDYLRGLEIPCDGVENGFCAILADGAAVGGGKAVNGTVKNHYPKGLRNR